LHQFSRKFTVERGSKKLYVINDAGKHQFKLIEFKTTSINFEVSVIFTLHNFKYNYSPFIDPSGKCKEFLLLLISKNNGQINFEMVIKISNLKNLTVKKYLKFNGQ